MARLVHRETGSVVVVPDEKAAQMYAMGYSPEQPKAPAKKAPARKTSSK